MTKTPPPAVSPGRRSKSILWGAAGMLVVVGMVCVLLAAGLIQHSPGAAATRPLAAVEPGINTASSLLLQLVPQSAPLSVAPALSLTDQDGKHVTLSQFRGKTVVLSFNDDQCEDLCTLLAQDVVAANQDLGTAAKDVVFLSVNANPYYPSATSVKQWTDAHGLGSAPNWIFVTGSPTQLAKTAADYGEPIELDPKARTVVHGSDLFFIDPAGQIAALGQFGTESASTALFSHVMAQAAVNLLPNASSIHVSGPSPANTTSTAGAAVDAAAPAFSLPKLEQPKFTTSSASLRGKVTVVNFWASTCTACVQEMPAMEQAYKDLGKDVNFVGIDVADNSSAATSFATKFGITYPLLSDTQGAASGAYQVPGLPFTAVIGADGTLQVRHPGALTAEQLEYVVQSLMPEGN
jgi:cytochrome oxidase Cu insertion factor (SCO1/SenC/PrrC family)